MKTKGQGGETTATLSQYNVQSDIKKFLAERNRCKNDVLIKQDSETKCMILHPFLVSGLNRLMFLSGKD
jgi:hypothetical protein